MAESCGKYRNTIFRGSKEETTVALLSYARFENVCRHLWSSTGCIKFTRSSRKVQKYFIYVVHRVCKSSGCNADTLQRTMFREYVRGQCTSGWQKGGTRNCWQTLLGSWHLRVIFIFTLLYNRFVSFTIILSSTVGKWKTFFQYRIVFSAIFTSYRVSPNLSLKISRIN